MKTKTIVQDLNALGYFLLQEYDDNSKTISVENTDGYKTIVLVKTFKISKYKPYFFHTSNPYTLENISLWLKLNRGDFELLKNNEYEKGHKRLIFFHNVEGCMEEFSMSWSNFSQGKGCPICHGLQVGIKKSLSYLRPDLAKEWHPDNLFTPKEVTLFSAKKVYWICSKCDYGKNKEWYASISNRTNLGRGCPFCSGRVVSNRNRLSIFFPDISQEWNYELNKDTPNDVAYGSTDKRWWNCTRGHSYFSSINSRTNMGSGCKQCANEQRESKIATDLKKWCENTFYNVDFEHKMFKNPETNYFLRCDIYIGEKNSINGIYIEVHGQQHYKFCPNWHVTEKGFFESLYRDNIKKKYAKKNGLYIEIDIRKIKTSEEAIEYVKRIVNKTKK